MRAVMVMFDSLNRHFLPNYGNDSVYMPNFERLEELTITFDKSYVASLPCIPAKKRASYRQIQLHAPKLGPAGTI